MCCGDEDDYYTATPYRPPHEKPFPSVIASQPRPQRPPQPQRRGMSREEIERIEKRQRQAQATVAARNYGWPTSQGIVGNGFTDRRQYAPGNRDSMIEPDLAGGLAAMPGSEFRAVYDPQRQQSRQPLRQQPSLRPQPPRQQQPLSRQKPASRRPPLPRQQPPPRQQPLPRQLSLQQPQPRRPVPQRYFQQSFITQQPSRMPSMSAAPTGAARQAVVQPAHAYVQPQKARLVRRDSNGISECSSDDDEDFRERLRNYTVSPIDAPSPKWRPQRGPVREGNAF